MGKLKVFGGCYDGRNRVVVGAEIKKEAHAAVAKAISRISYYGWDQYTSESGNDEEVSMCSFEPGVVFSQGMNERRGRWIRLTPKERS